jgi:hypothetical protein
MQKLQVNSSKPTVLASFKSYRNKIVITHEVSTVSVNCPNIMVSQAVPHMALCNSREFLTNMLTYTLESFKSADYVSGDRLELQTLKPGGTIPLVATHWNAKP